MTFSAFGLLTVITSPRPVILLNTADATTPIAINKTARRLNHDDRNAAQTGEACFRESDTQEIIRTNPILKQKFPAQHVARLHDCGRGLWQGGAQKSEIPAGASAAYSYSSRGCFEARGRAAWFPSPPSFRGSSRSKGSSRLLSSRPGRPPKRASDFMTMAPSPDALFDMKKRHLENGGFHNGHLPADLRLDKSPLLANGYHAPPHFNPLQYMAHHMAGLGYPPLLPGGIPGGMAGGGPVGPHPLSPSEASPLKHPQITPESLAKMHEERVDRERLMALEQRRGLTPTSMAGPHPLVPTSTHDDHQPPTSPVLNLSKGATLEDAHEEREDERDQDLASHDSGRDLHDEDRRHPHHEEDRLSDMDDDESKDESMDVADAWTRAASTLGQTQLTSPPVSAGAPVAMAGNAPLSSTEVLLRNILGLLRVAEENARHHERQTQYEKAELKMEVLRERELRETLEKQLQEEQKNRILMQKRCAKLKKLRRRLQERLDIEVKRRSHYEDHIRSNSPDALGDINDTIRKEMEAIAAEIQNENLQQQKQQQTEEREATDRLLASPALANHPAIAAATANAAWR
nr:uncharacterized protein LOC113829263 [Penaeus vannamei]